MTIHRLSDSSASAMRQQTHQPQLPSRRSNIHTLADLQPLETPAVGSHRLSEEDSQRISEMTRKIDLVMKMLEAGGNQRNGEVVSQINLPRSGQESEVNVAEAIEKAKEAENQLVTTLEKADVVLDRSLPASKKTCTEKFIHVFKLALSLQPFTYIISMIKKLLSTN